MHSSAFARSGLKLKYRAINIPGGETQPAFERLRNIGYRAVNVTIPHKEDAAAYQPTLNDPLVRELGVANVVNFGVVTANTDVSGFADVIAGLPAQLRSGPYLLLGAGGSARAVARALQGKDVRIWNRHFAKAAELASMFNARALPEPDPSNCTVVINATASSKNNEDIPVRWDNAPKVGVALDLFYASRQLPFHQTARRHGWLTIDGVGLLVAQGARSWPLFGITEEPPRTFMEEVVRAHLASHP